MMKNFISICIFITLLVCLFKLINTSAYDYIIVKSNDTFEFSDASLYCVVIELEENSVFKIKNSSNINCSILKASLDHTYYNTFSSVIEIEPNSVVNFYTNKIDGNLRIKVNNDSYIPDSKTIFNLHYKELTGSIETSLSKNDQINLIQDK